MDLSSRRKACSSASASASCCSLEIGLRLEAESEGWLGGSCPRAFRSFEVFGAGAGT